MSQFFLVGCFIRIKQLFGPMQQTVCFFFNFLFVLSGNVSYNILEVLSEMWAQINYNTKELSKFWSRYWHPLLFCLDLVWWNDWLHAKGPRERGTTAYSGILTAVIIGSLKITTRVGQIAASLTSLNVKNFHFQVIIETVTTKLQYFAVKTWKC